MNESGLALTLPWMQQNAYNVQDNVQNQMDEYFFSCFPNLVECFSTIEIFFPILFLVSTQTMVLTLTLFKYSEV